MPTSSMKVYTGGVAALFVLAACGSGGEADTPVATATAPAMEATVPTPTVVPNADPIETTHPNSIQPETTLSISAEATVKRAPDIALISAGVQTEGETALKAMQDNTAAMTGVFRALQRAGVDDRDMQTSNLSLQPRYDYSNRENGGPKLTGYTASNQLSVTVRNLDTLGQTMDALVDAGGNTFSGLSFGLADDRAAKDEARTLAMKDAITRAELYAETAGYKVARIVTVSESQRRGPQPMAAMRMSADIAESTPVAAGEVGYTVSVNVMFELRK